MPPLRSRYIFLTTLTYLVLGLLWIFSSDHILSIFADINSIVWLSTAKGVLFVLISALGFFFALNSIPEQDALVNTRLRDVVLSGFSFNRNSPWITYSFAIVISLLTVFVRLKFGIIEEHRPLMLLFVLPILLSATFGGLGPGVLSTILVAIGTNYFILYPRYSLAIKDNYDLLQWITLIFCGFTISIFCETLMRVRSKSESNLSY